MQSAMNYKRHIYCLLISLVMIGVTVPFHPGIPWTAWAGAFVLFMLESEVLLSMIDRDRDDEGRATDDIRRRRSRRMLVVAGAMAILLILIWVVLLVVI